MFVADFYVGLLLLRLSSPVHARATGVELTRLTKTVLSRVTLTR